MSLILEVLHEFYTHVDVTYVISFDILVISEYLILLSGCIHRIFHFREHRLFPYTSLVCYAVTSLECILAFIVSVILLLLEMYAYISINILFVSGCRICHFDSFHFNCNWV